MLDAFLVILSHPPSESGLVDDFADVFVNKLMWPDVALCSKAIPLFLSLDNCYFGIFLSLEALILAVWTAAAVTNALDAGCTVNAV